MKKSNLSENKVLKTDFLHILMSDYHPSNRTKKITTENHFVSFRTLQSYMLHKKGTDSSPTSRVYMAQAVNKRIENWQTIQYHSSSVCPLKDNLSVNSFSSKPTISEDIIKVTCSVLIITEGETFLYLQSGSHLEFISFFFVIKHIFLCNLQRLSPRPIKACYSIIFNPGHTSENKTDADLFDQHWGDEDSSLVI